MTLFRSVVSWLAVGFLTWRGGMLFLAWWQDRIGTRPLPEVPDLIYLLGLRGVTMDEILPWSAVWMGVALMILWPWLRALGLKWSGVAFREALAEDRPLVINMLGRWLFAMLWLGAVLDWFPRGLGGFLSFQPYALSEQLDGYFTSVFGSVFRALLAALLVAPELTVLASSGFTAFIDTVFFPGGREAKPPYTLKLARFYVEKERWAEAEAEYLRMLGFYPQAIEAWQERLKVAFLRTDAEGAEPVEVLAEALRAMPQANQKAALHASFEKQGR